MAQARTLKYGDVVRIHGMSKGDSLDKGILSAKGFTDPNIYYQKYEQFSQINLFRESLFQIIPKTSFHINDELLKDSLTPKEREAIKVRAASEETAMMNNLKVRHGTEVFYGAEVLFKHVDSGGFLMGVLEAAQSGQGSFKLNLTEQLSSYLGFKIRSHRSYERDGDKVYLDDPLEIYHNSSDCYVNFNDGTDFVFLDKEFQELEYIEEDPAISYLAEQPLIKIASPKRINVVNQNKSKCLWRFILYEDYAGTEDLATIKPHDIVFFEHTNRRGLLTSSLIRLEVTIKENNQCKDDITFYDSLWEMIPSETNETGPQKAGDYYARNIITGRYLCLHEGLLMADGDDASDKAVVQLMDEKSETPMSDGNLINLMVGEQKIDCGDKIPIDETLPKIKKSYIENIDSVQPVLMGKNASEHSFKIFKPPRKELSDILFVLSSFECLSKFCQLMRVPQDKVLDSSYYESLMGQCTDGVLEMVSHTLKALIGKVFECDYTEINNAGKTPSKKIQKMMVEAGLTQLTICLIYFMALHEKYISGENPEYRAQRNKLGGIFEDAYQLLEKIVINCEENRIYISRWVELIMKHSYKINKSCIQECLVGILQNNSISIEETIDDAKIQDLVDMFKDDAKRNGPHTKFLRLLSAFIKCAGGIFKTNQERVLRMFFQDETNDYRFKFKCNYKSSNDDNVEYNSELTKLGNSREVQIIYGKRDQLTLNDFYKNEKDVWNYFLEYVNLMADVCMDTNMASIETISSALPLQFVLVILSDPNVALVHSEISKENAERHAQNLPPKFQNIYEPFIRIAHHVYVKIRKFSPIRRIAKIEYWNDLKPDEDILRTKRVFEGEKEQEQRKYLDMMLEFIRMFLEKCELNPNNITEMRALYTTLDLLLGTVTLGLWKTVKQFREILPALFMKIIKFDNNYIFKNGSEAYLEKQELDKQSLKAIVIENKKNIQMAKPEMILAIECKNKAAEIFNLMIEMETNIRITNLTIFFKNLYEAKEDYEKYKIDQPELEIVSEAARVRNQSAREVFFQDNSDGLLVKNRRRKIEQKEIILEPNIWLNKLRELTPFMRENDPLQRYFFDRIENFDEIVLALLEVSEHQNFTMLNSSMLLLRKIFGQREDLINNFNNIVLCAKGNFYDITVKIRQMKQKFNMLRDAEVINYCESNAKNFQYVLWKPYDQSTKEELRRSGIIQDLWFLSRVLKQGTNLKNIEALMTVDQNIFKEGTLVPFYNERQQNDRLFQTMALVQQIHNSLFTYIKRIKEGSLTEDQRWLLLSIYNYLTLLVFNNLENKQRLLGDIKWVLPHLKYKVGAPQFIYNICFNNKILVNNEPLVRDIAEAIIAACGQFTIDDYERSNLLHSLRGLVMFNEKGHERNQKLVFSLIQKNRDLRLIENRPLSAIGITKKTSNMDFNMPAAATYMTTMFELFSVLVQSKNMINIGKLSNIHTYSYLLSTLRETNYWQLRRAIRAYINRLYYLNTDTDNFLFEEFIRNEFFIISQELSELVEIFTKTHEDREIENPIRFFYAGSHTYLALLEILTTLYNVLEKPVFHILFKRELDKKQRKGDTELHKQIVKIANNLGFIVNNRYTQNMKNKMTGSYIKVILDLLRRAMMEFDLGFLEETCNNQVLEEEAPEDLGEAETNKKHVYDYSKSFFRNLYEMIVMVNAKKRKDKLIREFKERKNNSDNSNDGRKNRFIDMIFSGKLVEGALNLTRMISAQRAIIRQETREPAHYNSTLMTSASRHFRVQARPTLNENEENLALNSKLSQVKLLLTYSPIFQKFINDQFIKLVRTLTSIDEISRRHYSDYCSRQLCINNYDTQVVSLDEIFKNMFKLCMEHPSDIDDRYKIPIIKLIRCYISEAIEKDQQYKLCVDSWDAEYVNNDEECKTEFEARQNRIDSCGGADFIVEILKENLDDRIEVFNEVLLLGIVFLFGGNAQCQTSILNALKKDSSNTMLVNLNSLIKRIGEFVQRMNEMKENKDKREKLFNFPHEDTYDYYNVREKVLEKKFGYETVDRMEAKVKADNENALVRCFRFLQLFCENNNVDMKKFLLVQIDESGVKKAKTINFIETTTLLLRKFFKIMNRNMSGFKLTLLLDFVNECTQIPCSDNQKALTKSSYFEDVCYMSSFFASHDNLKARLFDPDKPESMEQLFEIYQKSIMLALSNLEGNEDQIYSEFIAKCQGRFLWEITQRNLEEKIGKYKQEHGLPEEFGLADFDGVHITRMLEDMEASEKVFDEETNNILNIFTILFKVDDYGKVHFNLSQVDKQNINKDELAIGNTANNFRKSFMEAGRLSYPHMDVFTNLFEPLLLKIEVDCSSGKQNVYFPHNPVFKFLAKETKKRIMFEVNRETQRDKLIGILGYREEVFGEIKWNYEMKFQSKINIFRREIPLAITSELCTKVRKAALYLSIFIMVVMLLTVDIEHDVDEMTSEYSYGNFPKNIILKGLSLIQLGLSFGSLVIWIILRHPLALAKQAKQERDKAELESKMQQTAIEAPSDPGLLDRIRLAVLTFIYAQWDALSNSRFSFVARILAWIGDKLGLLTHPLLIVKKNLGDVGHLLKCFWNHEKEFGPLLLFVAVSIMGNTLGLQYFTIHIFDIFLQISLLGNVFKAITVNTNILMTLSLLAGAFIFVFNVLSFGTYSTTIYPDDLPEDVCEGLMDCVLIMYNSGAIGDSVDEFNVARFSFDLVYVVFMELLFQNMVGGVIIDSFTEMREKDEQIDSDKLGKCFICGKDRASIENENEVFHNHIKPHDLWNYLYYIYCLEQKDATDYSGMEYQINDKIQKDDVSWFPLFESGGEDELEGKMGELSAAIDQIKTGTLESHDRTIQDLEKLKEMVLARAE